MRQTLRFTLPTSVFLFSIAIFMVQLTFSELQTNLHRKLRNLNCSLAFDGDEIVRDTVESFLGVFHHAKILYLELIFLQILIIQYVYYNCI